MVQRYEIVVHGLTLFAIGGLFQGMAVICLPNGNTLTAGLPG